MSTEIKDLSDDPEVHQPGLDKGFAFGVGVSDANETLFKDESYFTVSIIQVTYVRDELSIDKTNLTFLETAEWDLQIINTEALGFRGNNSATIWPKHNDYQISGSHSSKKFEIVTIDLIKWVNSTTSNVTWATNEEIEEKMNAGQINVAILNSYMDFDDYDTVIKSYIDPTFTYTISTGVTKRPQLYVRK